MTESEPLVMYVGDEAARIAVDPRSGYSIHIWRPTVLDPIPPTMGPKWAAWSLLAGCGMFANSGYCVVFVRYGERIVHRSCVLPRYFRWPFMGANDLQVSSTWTEPKFRNKGLASITLTYILQTFAAPNRRFWYVSRESNEASIRACRRAGFNLHCYGIRRAPFGLDFLWRIRLLPSPPTEEKRRPDQDVAVADSYARYYSKMGADRNDLRRNRGTLFQTLASESSLIRALYKIPLELTNLRILDVGCGGGGSWYQFFRLGVHPSNMMGIDLQQGRLEGVGRLYPHATAIQADASKIPFSNSSFDLVYESTLFATLPDDRLRADIAAEMVRVCKSGGYLVLVDWRTPNPWARNYRALTRTEVQRHFCVGKTTSLLGITRGALIPPIGRSLSTYAQALYFFLGGICPPLVGQVVYVLRKH
jgi:SAM-dependent methyltransferase